MGTRNGNNQQAGLGLGGRFNCGDKVGGVIYNLARKGGRIRSPGGNPAASPLEFSSCFPDCFAFFPSFATMHRVPILAHEQVNDHGCDNVS